MKRRLLQHGLAILLPLHIAVQGAAPSPLADAVERGDKPEIRRRLAGTTELNAPQPDGMTPLHWAAYLEDLETTRMLLARGASARVTNRYGVTPLPLACQSGSAPIVQLLLENGADPNTALRGGESALMTAARTGRPEVVQALVGRGAEVNSRDRTGQTAIMWAAAEAHAEVVRILIKAGADFTTPLDSGFTPLFFAVREGRPEVVQVLLESGEDVNAVMRPARTSGRGPRKGTSPLFMAVENGHFELALMLIDAGADPNDMRTGFSPLHAISWVRKPNRGDNDDDLPPPTGSGKLGSLDFVRELVKRGADVNSRLKLSRTGKGQLNIREATPFFLAADTADVPLMRLLVELGADPHLKNSDETTALLAAAGVGTLAPGEEAGTELECIEAVRFALELGCDLNATDRNGETAMHGAAYKGYPRLVHFLTELGARPEVWNRKNKHGWTPLLIAQGYRPGNFRPLADTITAIEKVMVAAGLTPPKPDGQAENPTEYQAPN